VPVDDLRAVIGGLVSRVRPVDAQEAADQAAIASWIESGLPLFRTAPPATPPRHLVAYFVPLDAPGRSVLLGDHVKSGLWLPPGGHVEQGEDPRRTVERETLEELGIPASFHPRVGAREPFFLTANPTRGERSHVDVSLWFVLDCRRDVELRPDPREFRSVRWYNIDEQLEWPADSFDPQMTRFIRKLKAALPRDPLHVGSRTP
jgi:8-oxo-dGTP pyrophosphatase MutT (NUDIX family)